MKETHVYRVARSPFWYAAFYVLDGTSGKWKRRMVSTEKTDEGEALEVALEFARAANVASKHVGQTIRRGRVMQMITDILEAAAVDVRSMRELESWRAFCARWLEQKRGRRVAEKTVYRYALYTGRFTEFLGALADGPMQDLGVEQVQGFCAEVARKWGPENQKLHYAALRMVFGRAMKEGVIELNPTLLVDPPRSAPKGQRRRPFTVQEILTLVAWLRSGQGKMLHLAEWETMVWLGLCLGARLGDCAAMGTEHLDQDLWCLTFVPQKTRHQSQHPLTVPVAEPLRSHLAALVQRQKGPFCPSLIGKRANYLSRQFGAILERAGVGQELRASWDKKMKSLSFHSLRHALPTLLAAAGVPAAVRMQITGHKNEEVHLGYTHKDLDAMRLGLGAGLASLRA